ncbi:MAG: primosomal protein N' [Ferruginibacter sp.]|nr:primosomal protein N' [Ferruginibacter sp.]
MSKASLPEFFEITVADAWAEVLLPLALPQVYTYHIPPSLLDAVKIGCRAEVIFGKNKRYAGIIKKVTKKRPEFPTKPLLQILDEEPLVFPQQLNLWEWMAQYYMCSEGEVMSAALPVNFKLSSETILMFNEEAGEDFTHLSDEEYLVAEALQLKKQLTMHEVQGILAINHVYPVVKKLIEKQICIPWEKMAERIKPKKEKFITLNPTYNNEKALEALLNDWSGAPRQMELILSFIHLSKTTGEVKQPELLKKSGCTAPQLSALVKKGILVVEQRRIDRLHFEKQVLNLDFTLSDAQQQAWEDLQMALKQNNVVLMHGVTGSGKTLLNVKLMAEHFLKGEQVLYLLPEIALTAQLIRRLQHYFGGNISIYHSKFNDQERVELWNNVRTGKSKIVLGARSALFLPFQHLGLVIVDEEHDASYKQQDPAPRYNARDTAIYYASKMKAKVVLGSATPSLESYFNAKHGKYGLVNLKERYGGIQLPEIEIVSSQFSGKTGKTMITPQLNEAITNSLQKGEQVILFQNRRGYNPYLICGACGFIPQCEKCDVSLTMHKYSHKLHCHYCGNTYPLLTACPACGSQNWLEKNFGTEKVEEALEKEFDNYRIERMDVDSVRGKTAHDELINRFEKHQIDILVGTQMVVKGLDFEHVSLVGILDADGLLSFTDFRVNERGFQLMEQVSGRAGRKHQQGRVLIQALNINHPILKLVQQHDYIGLFEMELTKRKEFNYPPFSRIVKLTLKHKDREIVQQAAIELFKLLGKYIKDIVGPAAPLVARVRNQFLMELLIKLPSTLNRNQLKDLILADIRFLKAEKPFASITIVCDVDPM